MKLKYVLAALAVAAVVAAVLLGRSAQAQEGPTSGSLLAGGLSGMTGGAVGPDGAIYVVDAGTGGENIVQLPEEFGGGEANWGLTARIIRIDPDDGAITTAAANLPSFESEEGANSATDLTFLGDDIYWLLTGSANEVGIDEWPNGVYRVTDDGEDNELFADISAFNDANPVDFEDAGPGGNPFAIERRGSGFVVSDGNYNRLLSISPGGDITILSAFDNVVPTGLATESSGPVWNTWFSAAPHLPGDSKVVSVAVPGGTVTELASGPASMIDISFGPGGKAYVLQFSDYTEDESAPPGPTGRIYELSGSELILLVEGFVLPTSLNFSGDTAYVTTLMGEVWQIEDFSTIDPLPEPTAVPTSQPTTAPVATPTTGTGVTAPDTGSGGYLDSDGGASPWLLLVLLGAAAMIVAGGAVALRRP